MKTFPFLYALTFFSTIASYRILVINDLPARSVYTTFKLLYKELALRGNQVTVISFFEQGETIANYTEIKLAGSDISGDKEVNDLRYIQKRQLQLKYLMPCDLSKLSSHFCTNLFTTKSVQDMYNNNVTFDVVMVQMFHTDCVLQLAKMFKGVIVGYHSTVMVSWVGGRFGVPLNPAVVPNYFLPFGLEMTFFQRLENSVVTWGHLLYNRFVMVRRDQELVTKHFGKDASVGLEDIRQEASLLLLHSHFTVNLPKAMVPNVIEVGGIHLAKKERKQNLPKVC